MTHAVDFLHLVDHIIVMEGGRVLLEGKFDDIKSLAYMEKLLSLGQKSPARLSEPSPAR